MSDKLETKVECLTIKKPIHQKLYIQDDDYIDTIVINEKEYKVSDIVKHEKVLEIIKEKELDVWLFLFCHDLEIYNNMVDYDKKLTEEEYDSLKEVL